MKAIEEELNFRFSNVSYGHVTNSEFFQAESSINSNFHPISVSAYLTENRWTFKVHQSGFRSELLPEECEEETKKQTTIKIDDYIERIRNSKETDFHNYPQLWVYCKVVDGHPEVETRVIK